jgi:hypothetical protein
LIGPAVIPDPSLHHRTRHLTGLSQLDPVFRCFHHSRPLGVCARNDGAMFLAITGFPELDPKLMLVIVFAAPMAAPMQRLAEALKKSRPRGLRAEMSLVHRGPKSRTATQAVAAGVHVWAWQDFVRQL